MTYKSISPKFKQEFYSLVDRHQKILITTHLSPDDDAIGSALSLRFLLTKLYPLKNIQIAISGYPADRFSCFDGYETISFNQDITEVINNYQLLICLDGGQYSRFSTKPDLLKASNVPKICIDHHSSPPDNFTLVVANPQATSTAELIYKLADKKIKLDLGLAEPLLLGILGDTGTFNYIKPGQYYIFDFVKQILLATEIDIQEFKSRYMTINAEAFESIRELMKNSKFLHVDNWPDFQVSFLTREYILEKNLEDSQVSEGSDIFVAQYIRLVKNYSWGFVIRPNSDGSCRLSLRSLPGSVNVSDMMERMAIGGGHNRASGGKILPVDGNKLNPEKALEIVMNWMSKNKPVLV